MGGDLEIHGELITSDLPLNRVVHGSGGRAAVILDDATLGRRMLRSLQQTIRFR